MNITPTIAEIEHCTRLYAAAHKALAERVAALQETLDAAKRAALPEIRAAVNKAAEREAELQRLIEAGAGHFEKPRTHIFHRIKIGFRKGSGGIGWEDDAHVVALIKKHFPKAQAELLIRTTEKPIAKALAELEVSELKRIGCTIESTGDVVVIKPTDGDVDKIVAALLKGAAETAAEARRAE